MLIDKIILGTVQMGQEYGVNNTSGKLSHAESHEILYLAHSRGVRLLDTASAYGDAHHVIGSFHSNNPNTCFKVFTKLPNRMEKPVEDLVLTFLDELKVKSLEGLMFHSFQGFQHGNNVLSKLVRLRDAGVINKIGVSVYKTSDTKVVLNDERVDFIQMPFNLLDNVSQRGDLIKEIKKSGKLVHTRSAFLQGLFFKNVNEDHPVVRLLRNELLMIKVLSEAKKIDIAALALNYCLQQSQIDNVLIGVDSRSQLEHNLSLLEQIVSKDTMESIDAIQVSCLDALNPTLWKEM